MQNPYLKHSFVYQVAHEKVVSIVEPEQSEYQGFTSYTEWQISHLQASSRIDSQSLILNHELKDHQPYFLVSVIWDSSDSFNIFTSGCIQFVDVCSTFQQAQSLKEMIEQHHQDVRQRLYLYECVPQGSECEKKDTDFLLQWSDDAGEIKECACPWNGYFDQIAQIQISTISLQPSEENFLKMHL